MLYIRGNKRDYDSWAAGGAHGWSWDEVFPYFLKSEDNRDPALAKNGKWTSGVIMNNIILILDVSSTMNMKELSFLEIGFVSGNPALKFFWKGNRCSKALFYWLSSTNLINRWAPADEHCPLGSAIYSNFTSAAIFFKFVIHFYSIGIKTLLLHVHGLCCDLTCVNIYLYTNLFTISIYKILSNHNFCKSSKCCVVGSKISLLQFDEKFSWRNVYST